MADSMTMFMVTTGVFVAFVALIFGLRTRRFGKGYAPAAESHGE